MTDVSKLLAELSPEQWKLLQLRLKKKQAAQGEPDKAGRIQRRDPARQDLPLSFSQQRLWFLDQWEPGNPAYNIFAAFRLEGTLDRPALAATIEEIVRRHESLRTTFTSEAGRPRQVVAPPGPVPLPEIDVSALPAGPARDEARRIAEQQAGRSFDLAAGPLLRAVLVRLSPTEHWALLAVHHIVSDGWSMGVFNRELATLYTAFRQGAPSPLPPLAVQYPDYALWQREWLAGEKLAEQLAFWRGLLSGAPPLLDLPLDHPRGALPGAPAGTLPLLVPRPAADRLQALAVSEGGTLFMVLLAGFAALLARYTGSDDVVIGAPVANRNRTDIEGLIGFFVNTLALRVSTEGDPTGRELLRRARKVTSGAYDHQDVPFELLVDELQPERDLTHPPLVQVTLSLQNLPPQSVELPGLRLTVVPLDSTTAKFDMVWAFSETPAGLSGAIEVNLSLFELATAARMAGHFARLLEELSSRPDVQLSDLDLLSQTERHQLLVDWNDTATAFPRESTVAELFEEQVAKAPDATAVVFKDQSLTYGELDARAGRLARRLSRLGVGPEVPVGLCADRSLDLIVGLLAIVKAGGAFVPLDPAYPADRLGYMLESSGAPLVLAQAGTRSSLPEDVQARVLLLEEVQGEDLEREDAPIVRLVPENLLYIIYTSGSTGKPKGVAVSHRSAIRLVRDVDYARLDASETFLQIVPLSFDPSMFEIWGALLNGARLVLFPTRVPTLEEIEETVRDKGVTTLWLTTGLFHQVVDHKFEALLPLRQLLAGGEALSLPHVRKVLERLPGVRMVNGYGPTEVTCFTTTWKAEPLPADATGVPIGKPMSNTRTLVLGRHDGRLLPVGVWGELYAGGEGVARGYFGRPDLTAERFVPDPFPLPGEPGARLYRTGDRARLLADGTIEFAGRYDNQVKVRGFRIELGEIETALSQLPGVLESTVLVREDSPGVRRITGYVVPKHGIALDPETLRAGLSETLPEYMVPTAWVVLDALPLTPNGKIDRRALPAPGLEREAAEYVAPRNETEALLAGIWAEVLGAERVGVEDDFFDLGGNSLLSLQVAARAGQAGLSFHVREMFEHSTIASLARALGAAPETAEVEPPIVPVPHDRPLPLSFAQQRLWFLDRLEPGPIYNIFTGLRLTGRLDVSALQRAVTEVVRRHEAVRSIFATEDGEPVQIVMPPPESFPIEVIDLSSSPSEARSLVVEEAAKPFDLAHGPLLRTTLVRLAPEEHLALLTMHHIASDGWSMGILVREITTLYAAFLEGRPSPLPDLQVQYADFAVWQRGWLSGQVLENEIAFWRETLAGAPPVLELPTDRPRPSTQRHRGAAETRVMPAGLMADLDTLSRREGASLFMTLLAATQTLLFRVSGQDDVVVGSPVANRNRLEIEPLIGFFVNTLVLRTVLSGDPGFREAVGRVREGALSAYAHQDVPFERLVEELRPERSLSHTPIFQVMVVLQNMARDRFSLPGLEAEGLAGEQTTAKFDLLFAFAETPQGLIANLEYDTDLFFPATARRLLSQLETLLAAAVQEPDRKIGELPLLSAPERQQLLVEWNDAAVTWPVEGCLHELIEAQVARAPEAPAVTFEDRTLSYAELNGLADRWARTLRGLGVGPETLVGVCMERSIEMVVALVSVIKAGGAYVPIDPSYPKDRLTYMLEDSRVPVLLTQERLLPSLPLPEGDGPRAVCMDASEPPASQGRPESGTSAKSAAYAIYTSGSTGRPKGAVNTHEGIVNRLLWMQSAYGLGPGDHVLQKTPFSFDVSVWEFFWPLMTGARLVVAKPGGHQDPSYLARLIQDEGITTLHFVPSMLQVFLEEPAVAGCTSLRRVMASGEALPVELEERFFERMPEGVELHNLYGPTEAAVDVTYEPCVPNRGASSVPIGRPVANTRIHLLDRSMRLVPMGVAGELHIGGIQLARGYLRRPELTAERFVPDPCSEDSGARLYKTGDLARHLPDGRVEYLGRLDFQVKVRGFRIELGEIEAALNRHPAVRESVVVARDDRGDKRLVAYVVPAKGEEISVPALRESLGAGLPEHMVPSVFVVLEALPLSPNGKVDRKALPAPDESGTGGEWVAPRTPAEELLATVWSEILGRERVGSTDNFFELGGHSLLATQVVSRVRKVFGVELPLRALFAKPTLAALAREIETGAAGEAALPPITPQEWEGGRPLSFAQQRLWFLDRLEPGNAVYNLPLAFRLLGRLEIPALAAAISGVVRRHEALRTRFEVVAGEPVQVVDPPIPIEVPVIDLSGSDSGEAERLARLDAARPFDLARGPLLRVSLVRLAEEEHLVLANMHHIVSDGWSMGVFIREVAALYEAARSGRPSPLPPLPVQYSDFAVWQRRHLAGEVLEGQLAYWRERLAGAPAALELPTDRPRPVVRRQLGAQLPWSTSPELLERLEDLARRRGVTLFMVLLAAFQTLLRRHGGQSDCLVGSPIANRNRAEIEGLIGFFVNALVLRGDLSGSPTFTELLERTREAALGAYAHQDLPFEKLVEELQPERSLSHTPLFQVVLGLQNAPVSAMELPGLRLEPVIPETGTAKFDLTVLLGAGSNGITGTFEYDLDLFDPATVQAIAGRYAVLLEGVAENPDRRLSDLPLLSASEHEQLIVGWNDTATAFPGDRTIDALFEEQVANTPDSTAVVFKDQSLTYAELNTEADRLARRLRQLGVGPEVPVGLCADRSLDLMVGLLAIIKAGGAFVPLDPAYPSERLGYMLESSGAPLVLAQSGTLSALPETTARVLLIEELRGESVDVRDSSVLRACPENLLYIMYTSGSTGRPKGVAITHRSAIRLVRDTNYARFAADETYLQLVPLSFDPSMFEIWGALLHGAKLVLFPARVPLPEDLEETIRTQGVTTLWLTTGLFHQVIDHKVEALAPLRQLLAGGEALSLPHVNKVVETFPHIRLVNGYGPTEVTCFTTCWQAHPLPPDAPCVPIGKPISNTRVLILDADGQPVPRGVSGELYAGGVAVARCYFGRPDLTAERFVPDPFPPPGEEGARLYRTGDRVRYLPDGTIEFFGRFDNQVKVRGFRIELGEIETAISRHPGVREAIVLVREDSPGYRRLVAYVVPREGADLDMAGLKSFTGGALPEYMVPGAWVFLASLPLTPNGKVDRRALPAPGDEAVGATGEDYVAPRTPVEEILAGLWAEVLGAERIGVYDDFFERGGHSLLATRLISGVRTAFGVDLPMRKLFEAPTVGEFALEVEEARRAELGSGVPPIEPRTEREGDLPLSFAQERLWFLDQLDSDPAAHAAYNLSVPVRLLGELDAGALRLALGELVRRHESLRTTFPSVGGRPVQRIGKPFEVPFTEADLSGLPEPEVRRRLALETARPFDLATGPLVRAALFHVGDQEHVFALTQHHIVTDGWSMGVLIRELAAIYGAFASGKPSPLADPALQYADFAVWQRRWLQGEALERQLDFWKGQLAGELPVLELPTSRPRPAVQTYRGESEFRLLPAELSEGVLKLGRREGATLFMTLLAAFGALLHRLSGQDDVLVGTPIAGRNRAEVESMLGFFVNTLVLRSDLSGNPAFRELLARVRETALGAYAHQDLPFEKLVAEIQPDRDLSRTPLFQVFFNVLNFTRERFEMPKLAMEGIEAPPPPSKFDLTLYVSERPEGIGLLLLYNADLFDAERMAGFLAQLEGMLAAFVAEPETPIDEVSLVTEAARAVLPDPAEPILEQLGLLPVHELIARRAAAAPGRIAVRDGEEIWTYGQLEAQANRLARRLLDAGLRKGEVVAIDARRSAMLPLSVLGILKAGGAFLILDPAYPAPRRASYLRLAEPRVLIGTEPLPEECEVELSSCARIDLSGLDEGDASAPAVAVDPHDLAYVAFTSGSTGTPKGILGEHAPLSHFFGWHGETFGFGPDDRFSLLSGLAHDPLLRDLFTPLTVGGTLCIPGGGVYEDPRSLLAWLAAERVSVMHLTPALAQMLSHGMTGGVSEHPLPDLRFAFFGGDRLTGRDIAGLQSLAPRVRCFNFYGATETPQAMGWHAVTAEEAGAADQVLPVGRGIEGVQLLVLNRRDLLGGVGELGEITVRTPYLTRGYAGDEELTARRFPANPFTGDPADRVYRTGDLGRYRPDGQVEFAGRADAQVKIRGFRIELAEVEAAVARHPQVATVAVLAVEEEGDRRLVAYVVPREESLASPALRAFLGDLLPAYMVPSAFVFLDRLPLTPNGKLDRRALARLAAPRETITEVGRVAPRTPIEEMLAELWTDLLRIEGLSVHDSFFDLGGHSLLATQMVSRVREAFGVELPLRRLFETPTVAGLAAAVEAARQDGRAVAPPIVPRTSTPEITEPPLSFSQERLWILDQLEPGNASYNMPAALRLRGTLDVNALAAAFTEIVRRHEVLRTVFASREGRPVQVIQPPAPFALPVITVESEEEARRIAASETARPFDLSLGPLLRATLLKIAGDDHLLVACMHHIVSDGWSMGIFVAEIAAIYGAFAAGRPSPLPPLPVQYADFAEWQRAWLSGEVLEGQIAYWRERLAGAPALLELPTDRPRPPVQTFNGVRRAVLLPAGLSEALLALTRRTGTTPFMLLLAAFEVLLHRYTGADDVVVGTPIAGRTRREIEGLIGFFVNTLVLRDGLGDEPAFTALLARVKEGALGAFAHQDLPFERLVEELRPERHLAYSPLFQVMFTLQNAPIASVDLPGLTLEPVEAVHRSARFDWTLSLSATPRGIGGYLEYNTDLFDGTTIERALGSLETLLGGIAAEPGRSVSELPLLPEAERRQVLEAWNETPAPAWEGPVHRLFAEQAARTPDAIALVCRGEEMTYAELDRRSSAVARRLASLGARPDVPVALSMERSLEMVVGLLGIWKAGSAYLPLDPAYPEDRLAFMLEDSGATILLTHAEVPDRDWNGRIVKLAPGGGVPETAASITPSGPDHLAYILYTSGSTGRPKGVQITHRALANFLGAMRREPGLEPADVMVAVTSLSFDIAGLELWLPLLIGSRVVVATREESADGRLLRGLVERSGGTVLQGTPATWRLLLAAGWQGGSNFKALCGGEAFPPALATALRERTGSVWNLYGPTETTVWSSVSEVATVTEGAPVSIGRPIDATTIYLVDPNGEPVPVGVAGELRIGGVGLARGYLGRPDLTADRFVPDPFGQAGDRLYRTGDLARWRPDGTLECLGRIDHQVKVRGFRIELGEIEAALGRHPAVAQAAVAVRGEGDARKLVAYVVFRSETGRATPSDLRAHLRASLPEYMVPGAWMEMESLPLTPNGKVDRKALPAPELPRGEEAYVAPRTPTEELLAELWAELLGAGRVGAQSDFFELGGHSLLATQLVSRLRDTFGVELPLRRVFERSTLAALAGEIEAASREGAPVPPIVPAPRKGEPGEGLTLSFGQERLWFLDQLQPGTSAYNIATAVRLDGRLDVTAFRDSLREVVRRHESLRTTFGVRQGTPVQIVEPELVLEVPLVDLGHVPQAELDATVRRLAREEARQPFDLAAGPLVRAVLLRLGDEAHVALLTLHHIISDGWSMGVLVREIAALYPAFATGEPSPLPALPVQYADFAHWQRQWLQGEVLEAELAYWRRQLAGAPPLLDLPADKPRPAFQRYRGRQMQKPLPAALVEDLRAFCRRAGATPFMALLAAFETLLHRYTGREDMVVGTPIAGRNRLETEGLIGYFLNSLVLRTSLAGEPGFRETVARTREVTLGAYAHQDLPFEKLVEELGAERNLSHAPLFQVMLVFQNTPRQRLELPGLTLSPVEIEIGTAKFDLVLRVHESPNGLLLEWVYNRDLFEGSTVSRMAGHFETLLRGALADPGLPILDLPILTPREEQQILEWNSTVVAYPQDVCLHELIEAQVERTPDRVALLYEDESLTYRALNARANRLARRLVRLGVGPNVLVGVCAERSIGMVVSLLAILKAGGAYVPLDPDYPRERLGWMLEDSRMPVLLAQERLLDRLPEHEALILPLETEEADGAREDESNLKTGETGVEATDLAYAIFTSGSTGRPKGTLNTHRGIVNRLLWMQDEYGLTGDDRVLQKTPYSFDVSVWEFFWPLLSGARLVVARPGGHQDPAYLVQTIVTQGITTLHFVPSMLQVFVEAPGIERCVSIERVVCSGEALPLDLVRRFHARLEAGLHNLYGPTEAAVDVTYWACERESDRGVVPIGRPVANTQIHLLDPNSRPVPVGVPGELYIGGIQLARGYLSRPDLTAERFVPDPFSTVPGARLYRTGDLARYLPEGAVDFLGRIDHQVKIRGFRIELGEIESALAAHPALREAVVVALAEKTGSGSTDRRLVAYVVPREGESPTAADLRTALARNLPEYMIPAAFVFLKAFPLTPSGKVDRKALPAPERPASLRREMVAPRNELERFLAGLWTAVLPGVETGQVGIHDNFFDLGGNSISGAVFINRLQEKLGEIVHVAVLFDAPTVAGLSAYLMEHYEGAVSRLFGSALIEEAERAGEVKVRRGAGRVTPERVAELQRIIRPLPPLVRKAAKNPPAVFVLSPPRSGSTLLRVMMAGHPLLFAPPELELLSFNTMAERRDAFPGRNSFWLEGAMRAVMEIDGCGPDEAKALLAEMEESGATTQDFFRWMQERISPRLLVDKTPPYAMDLDVLRRAEETFENARYIHLLRHPMAMIRSFEEAKLDQVVFPYPHSFGRLELAEMIWLVSHQNILRFLEEVPAERQMPLRFEELLQRPEAVLRELCGFLGIDYHPDMAAPYKNKESRMTDGIHAQSRMLGDVKFHTHGKVDASVAERWKEELKDHVLGEETADLTEQLGYERPAAPADKPERPAVLVPLQANGERPPFFLIHPAGGTVLCYAELARELGADQPVYALRSLGVEAGETPLGSIEALADHYMSAILAVDPEGPYYLGGWSFGGFVAYEVARKLTASGRRVAVLALLDASASLLTDPPHWDEVEILARAFEESLGVTAEELRLLPPDQRLAHVLALTEARGGIVLGPEQARRYLDVYQANHHALYSYVPGPYAGRVTLVRAEATAERFAGDETLGWAGLAAGGVEIFPVPGRHEGVVTQPNAGRVAEMLRAAMDETLSEEARSAAPAAG